MSGEIQSDVVDKYRVVRAGIEREANRLLEAVDFADQAEKWAFIAIIMKHEDEKFPEIARRVQRGKVLEFRYRIPFESYMLATREERIRITCASLARCVSAMEEMGVSSADRAKFSAIVAGAEQGALAALAGEGRVG